MSNCSICGKRFTCGCQKKYDANGAAICKNPDTCASNPQKKETADSRGLSMNLAKQKIMDLKNG